MSEHIQRIAKKITESEQSLDNACKGIQEGALTLTNLVRVTNSVSQLVRNEVLRKLVQDERSIVLVEAETPNEGTAMEGRFQLSLCPTKTEDKYSSVAISLRLYYYDTRENVREVDPKENLFIDDKPGNGPEAMAKQITKFIKERIKSFPLDLPDQVSFADEIAAVMNPEFLQKRIEDLIGIARHAS